MISKGEMKNYPENWSEFKKEIDMLLRYYDSGYEKRWYLTPVRYMDGIKETPKKYPLLAKENPAIQKRYISFFLKDQGRISRKEKMKKCVWVLPEALE